MIQLQEETKMAYSAIYDSSYDYTVYDLGFIFECDDDINCCAKNEEVEN